jgi:hypothetical protein
MTDRYSNVTITFGAERLSYVCFHGAAGSAAVDLSLQAKF